MRILQIRLQWSNSIFNLAKKEFDNVWEKNLSYLGLFLGWSLLSVSQDITAWIKWETELLFLSRNKPRGDKSQDDGSGQHMAG